jgi:hypothetical protein
MLTFSHLEIANSPGTQLARKITEQYRRPVATVCLRAPGAKQQAIEFCQQLGPAGPLNIFGPRESEAPGIYRAARELLSELWLDMHKK